MEKKPELIEYQRFNKDQRRVPNVLKIYVKPELIEYGQLNGITVSCGKEC